MKREKDNQDEHPEYPKKHKHRAKLKSYERIKHHNINEYSEDV